MPFDVSRAVQKKTPISLKTTEVLSFQWINLAEEYDFNDGPKSNVTHKGGF